MAKEWQKKEHSSTYWVQDRSNEEEMIRLQQQGKMVTASMGGVLSEQPHPICFRRLLDVGCGTGEWLIEAAESYPDIAQLVGVDVSTSMLEYARTHAQKLDVAKRVEFHVMDALRMLEFPNAFFDLVNQRLGMSYLRTWDWPKLLGEYKRVTKPGGVIRITECSIPESNSPALTELNTLMFQSLSRSGHIFKPDDRDGVINELVPLLERNGLRDVQTQLYKIEYRTGTPEWKSFCEDEKHLFRVLLPFFQKWCRVPDNYQEIYQRADDEMQMPDFAGSWTLRMAWGIHGD